VCLKESTERSQAVVWFQLAKMRLTTFPKKISDFLRWDFGLGLADSQSDSQSFYALNTASIWAAASRLTDGRTVEYVSSVRVICECLRIS
jgi:hypothetical protein